MASWRAWSQSIVRPFAARLASDDQRRHVQDFPTGLLLKLEHKTAERITYLQVQERQDLERFIGLSPWDHAPLPGTPARRVGGDLGEAGGMHVSNP